ncbi:hypothetical protein WISP_36327 [Willisornis vidua]|uniref:Reverse transcriptase domain-containing protein n=1 Tax=Willisornis vidua TaxID=1566151 RepID=A0ABQ9DJ46_9PASS|nr:hypothetical protein WISP_36327 [Willisornis vidua]
MVIKCTPSKFADNTKVDGSVDLLEVTHLVDEGKAVEVVYLDLSKAFETVYHNMILEKLAAHALDRGTLCWEKLAG